MSELIIVKPEKCVGCNACVRECPAPEANMTKQLEDGRFITMVNHDKCIGCGECVKKCNHGARDFIDDTDECIAEIIKEKIIIMASPAIKTVLPTKWKGVLDWFKKQGCTIFDVSLGADICTWAHLRTIEQDKIGNIITQQCPAIVKYIEIYQPKLLQNLSPIHSPAACSAIYIKKYLRRNNPIAFITPCIAARNEAKDTELFDYNITIKKLLEYFDRNDITIPIDTSEDYEYKFDEPQGQLGSIYSRPGGLRDNLWIHDPELNITNSEGVHKVFSEIEMYGRMPESKHPKVFDVLSCEFGCNIGPASGTKQTVFDVMSTMRAIENDAKGRRKSTGIMGRGDDRLFKKFDDELRVADFLRNYKPSMPTPVPGIAQLDPIFKKMGMHTEEDRKYDCHACGYDTCRDMAIAIYRGLNTPDNCIVHAKSVLLARHSALNRQNEQLDEITAECLELSDKLKDNVAKINENMKNIGESTTATSERAAVVKDLLENVVTFCNDNSTMDADSVSQLTSILETTIAAFSALDDNVSRTNESSETINQSIKDIISLVGEINGVLGKTDSKENAEPVEVKAE
ncbi:[Fe-Fe] hydrogenase large subunit C-terminal domain-containing protein [Ruminococcus sp.]|uniref:[Fe-Fe] hydrogenase large subunit C-terminal domain-containing protein n=1 Tax=Ruminococcus sp. TaxID=41978 RepID=UPI002D0E792E|nr:[Fe-Fe] hydrogenase large subunit C-terminal domain-containing protein [Ruminococcus sp.]HOA00522.1 [Fe-Fe] hydrogenase large subunit C-terminal domain-containing protein [Ruminococcus sp.]HOH87822.1 [Fe-Fe] hydrogenase large subunit C-terminal domain-containing protein [Ruminococcus sp.]